MDEATDDRSMVTFLVSNAVKKPSPVISPPDAFIFTVNKIYRPAFRLPDKKYQISERAYNEMMRKETNRVAGAGSFGEYGDPDYWKQNQSELNRMAKNNINVRRVLESDEVVKMTGVKASSGSFVRVFVWKKHCDSDFETGRTYALLGYDLKNRGNIIELTSVLSSTSIPLVDSPVFVAPSAPCSNISQIMMAAQSCTANMEIDFVAKVISLRPYKISTGQSVVVRDVNGEEIKIKFVYGVETEGVAPIIHPGSVIGFTGLLIHHPITKLHRYLFTDEYTQFFTGSLMPSHLRAGFRKLSKLN